MAIGAFLQGFAVKKGIGKGIKSGIKSNVRKVKSGSFFNKSSGGKRKDKKINSALTLYKKNDKKEKSSIKLFDKKKKGEIERAKQKEEESKLEATNDKKRKKVSRLKGAGGGILSKIIDFLTTILIGWVVDKLPKILKFAEDVIERIKKIVESIKEFGKTVGDFFNKIKETVGGVVEKIKEFDFSKIGENIKKKISGIKDAFTNMIDKIKGGLGILKKKEKEDPKKLAKKDKIEMEDESKVDTKELISNNENSKVEGRKEFQNFDETIKKYSNLEDNLKLKTGENPYKNKKKIKVDKLMVASESSAVKEFNKDPSVKTESESIKSDLSTITFDGKTYPMGSSGLGGYIPGGGEGGSTYKNKLNNNDNLISSNVNYDTNNLMKPNTKKIIKVNNPVHIPNEGGGSGQGGTEVIYVKQKDNSVKDSLLINAAYT